MHISKKSTSQNLLIPFIDFVPAEVKETSGENWRIVFYSKKPGTNEMQRFRRRVKKVAGKTARMQYAKRICTEINNKLAEGWSPFINEYSKNEYVLFRKVIDQFIEQTKRKEKDGLLRKDTLRAYTSFAKNVLDYIKKEGRGEMFSVEFNKKFAVNFLDYIYFERKRSARTSNNYLSFLGMLAEFSLDREYIATNPTAGVSKRKNSKKKREVIPKKERDDIFKYWYRENKHYLCLCLSVYFCFIRRTEITKLKVKHVQLNEDAIFIPAEISKNKKDAVVTIPTKLKEIMRFHLEKGKQEDYLFSKENFMPGKDPVAPKKVSDTWTKMRKELKIKDVYQFYSLKDTGITELFLLNVPTIKIRDQARHYDIKVTESYTPRNYTADETIKNLDFDF